MPKRKISGQKMDNRFKIVLIGDSGVGKTSVITKFTRDRFNTSVDPTVGIDFLAKTVELGETYYRLQLWDTAGQERFHSLIPSYMRNAQAVIMCFDLCSRSTFENLDNWLEKLDDHSVVCVCGCKLDLADESQRDVTADERKSKRDVTADEAKKWAEANNCFYRETSSKSGKNIEKLFMDILQKLIETREKQAQIPLKIISLDNTVNPAESNGYCSGC